MRCQQTAARLRNCGSPRDRNAQFSKFWFGRCLVDADRELGAASLAEALALSSDCLLLTSVPAKCSRRALAVRLRPPARPVCQVSSAVSIRTLTADSLGLEDTIVNPTVGLCASIPAPTPQSVRIAAVD